MTLRPIRSCYAPSGRFDAARLAVVLAATVAAAGGIALAFEGMLLAGWYFSALASMLPMTLASGCIGWGVRYGHCRNRAIAAVLGAACGLSGYAAYFHVDQCVRWDVPATAIDRLPGYVAFRLQTDTWRMLQKGAVLEPMKPQPNVQPQAPLAAVNLISVNFALFLFEAGSLALVPLATGMALASRPYSEKQRRWCSRESILVTTAEGIRLRAALETGDVAAWADSDPRRAPEHQPHSKLTAWYAPWDRESGLDCEVFLSIDNGPRWQLESEEAAAFIQLLPDMQDIVGAAASSGNDFEAQRDPSVAHMWPVPAAYAGPAHTPWQRQLVAFRRRLIIFGPYVMGIVALVGGTSLLSEWVIKPGLLPDWVLVFYVAGLGFPLAILAKMRLTPRRFCESHMADCRRLLRKTIARRPDPIVKVDDPDAIYVELVPRRQWETGQLPRRHETNEGLLKFAGVALIEGENHRISLPAASILSAQIEGLPGLPRTVEGLYLVVLRVRLDSSVRDLPFFPLGGLGVEGNWNRASTLFALFAEYCARELGQLPSQPPDPIEVPIPG